MVKVLVRKIVGKINEIGVPRTLIFCIRKAVWRVSRPVLQNRQRIHPFDSKYGTDTSGIVDPMALDIPNHRIASAVRYQSAIVEVFLEILNSLDIKHEEFVFVDFGSGKGRALLLASQFPFKRIIGVELSRRLHMIACRNIEVYADQAQQCRELKSLCMDVTDYNLPAENIVLYLFNPFSDEVLRAVLPKIEESFRQHPRDIYIAYLKPMHRHLLDTALFLRSCKDVGKYVIYRTNNTH